jgi:hypothetical protein
MHVLAACAANYIRRARYQGPIRAMLKRILLNRLARLRVLILDTPWQDAKSQVRHGKSQVRHGWCERAAYLDGNQAFAVDYQVCRRCGLGWVEQPYTLEQYQRRGLAAAALAALRTENPGLEWHTLGGHLRDSESFWAAISEGISGGYQQREMCAHHSSGG